jgi:hypothetical protein
MPMPMLMLVLVLVGMGVSVGLWVGVTLTMVRFGFVMMPVLVVMLVIVAMLVCVVMLEMNIEFNAGDRRAGRACDVQMIFVQPELTQFAFEPRKINSQVQQGADQHVAADSAEDIQINCFHRLGRAARVRFLGG